MPVTVTSFGPLSSTQTFVVPDGVFSLDAVVRGACGGGGQTTGHPRGLGAVMSGTLAVTPGETLYLQVAQAGGASGTSANVGNAAGGYPDGGNGGFGPANNRGGGGGGSTRIWRVGVGGTLVLVCGGGGGAAARDTAANPRTMDGGVPLGEPTDGDPATGNGGNGNGGGSAPATLGGRGGTPSAGGAGGVGVAAGHINGGAGGSFAGGVGQPGTGSGAIGTILSSGGGGGGYFGGGGGAVSGIPASSAGGAGTGGGGSSYIDLSQGWTDTFWNNIIVPETTTLQFFLAAVRFTYVIPSPGGWSLGLVSKLG